MAANPGRTVTVIAPEELGGADAAGSPSPDLEVDLEADRPVTGAISFAGATLARLRGRRPRGEASAPGCQAPGQKAGAAASGASRRGQSARARVAAADLAATTVADPETPCGPRRGGRAASVMPRAARGGARRGEQDPAGHHEPDGERDPVHLRRQPHRHPRVDRRRRRARDDRGRDHGEGIPPQIREKIFQRFWRADTSRTRETGGSGLGLAIVSSIVAAHNGMVDVIETPGGGRPSASRSRSPDRRPPRSA